ncbi:hypothetical protein [Pradoshia sp.]|uniref:hypothetical protein n=1 Tax=Pradoshia sp. TaxID=2651281 RepID=UPI003EFE0D45
MKKYLLFIICFVLFYLAYEFVSGIVLTALYIPDFMSHHPSEETVFFELRSSLSLLPALSIATLAYLLSDLIDKKTTRKTPNR